MREISTETAGAGGGAGIFNLARSWCEAGTSLELNY